MLRKNKLTCVLFGILISCHSNIEKAPISKSNDNLYLFFKSKMWSFPVEVSDTLFPITHNQEKEKNLGVKKNLIFWGNLVLSKDSIHEAIRILPSNIYFYNRDTMIICKVYFYSKNYKNRKSTATPDNYSVVNNRFYYTIGNPVFQLKDGNLIFIGYPDYLDKNMLPETRFNPN